MPDGVYNPLSIPCIYGTLGINIDFCQLIQHMATLWYACANIGPALKISGNNFDAKAPSCVGGKVSAKSGITMSGVGLDIDRCIISWRYFFTTSWPKLIFNEK